MRIEFPKYDRPKRVRRDSLKPGDLFTHNELGEYENPTVWLALKTMTGTGLLECVDPETGDKNKTHPEALVYKLDGVLQVSYSRG